jgi:hypothetical protein
MDKNEFVNNLFNFFTSLGLSNLDIGFILTIIAICGFILVIQLPGAIKDILTRIRSYRINKRLKRKKKLP